MIESKHRNELHRLLSPYVYALGMTGVAQTGVADAWYSGRECDLWSEHKRFPSVPPTIDLMKTSVTTKQQQDWLRARYAEGRNVSMIVFIDGAIGGRETGCLLLLGLRWELPIKRDEFLRKMKTRRELADEIINFVGLIPGGPQP